MPSATVIVEGAEHLAATLRAAGIAMADMPDENRSTAATISRAALSRVPRRSGALAASIRADTAKGEAIVYAGSYSVPYAGVINFGWPARNISAQPFLTDALTSTESQWLKDYERGIQHICDSVRGA